MTYTHNIYVYNAQATVYDYVAARRASHICSRVRVSAALTVRVAPTSRRLRASVAGACSNIAKKPRSRASLSSMEPRRLYT